MQILIVVFFVAVGIQLLYLIAFSIVFFKKRPSPAPSQLPVSVLVCAHDEEVNLKELIPQLLSQDYPKFEVIVVNDRSNDNTYDYLLAETKRDPRLKMVDVKSTPDHVNGKKFGITLGIKAASFEWILLTDADCRPKGNQWISSMSQHFDDSASFVLGMSPYVRKAGFLNLFIRFESLLTAIQYFAFGWMKNPYMGVGRNLAYRKSLFLEKKGFNNFIGVTGGDDDLFVNQHANGTNTRLELQAASQVESFPETTMSGFFYQKVRHLSVGKKYRFSHRLLLGIFTLTWIITWFAGIPALIIAENYWVWSAFALRLIVLILLVRTMVKKASLTFELWVIPVLDFLYSIYYISTGLVAFTTKKIRWRK